jgi:hypothetical protein
MRWQTVVLGLIIGTVFYLVMAGMVMLPVAQAFAVPTTNAALAALLLMVALHGIALRAVLPVEAAIRFEDRFRLLRAVAFYSADAPGWWEQVTRTETRVRYVLTLRFNLVRFDTELTITLAANTAVIAGPRRQVRLLIRWLEAQAAADAIPLTDADTYTPPGIASHLHRGE